jgi:large subunit ribosomal protein L6
VPAGIEVKIEKDPKGNPLIHLSSHDKQLIGEVAAKIRKLKKPEPYKGKGIRFLGEVIKLKAGKAAKK